MTPFKKTSDIWKHLFSGGKIKRISTINSFLIGFEDGVLMDLTCGFMCEKVDFSCPDCWLPYFDPIKLEFIADIDTIQRTADDSNRVTGINLNLKDHLVIDYDIKAPARFKVSMTEIVVEG